MIRNRLSLALGLAIGLALGAGTAQAGPDRVMGGGLRQLVNAWETADPRLPAQMSLHIRNVDGDPMVRVRLEAGATAEQVLPALQAAGFRLTAKSAIDANQIEGYLPLRQARHAAGLAGVRSVHAQLRPIRNAGAVQSQAVALHKADLAQAGGFDGAGIRIGVLSDSYNACGKNCSTTAPGDIASGDLPSAGVTVLEDLGPLDGGTDEGRAMLQLIHDIAPGATLGFATASNGQLGFANNILALRNSFKADVIVDDVIYFAEPMFSDGILAQVVDAVSRSGAAYFSSAGNNGLESYQATYTPVPFEAALRLVAQGRANVKLDQIPADIRPKSVHLFGSGVFDGAAGITQAFTSAATNFISFQWDEPFFQDKVATDFNIYVFDKDGNWMDPSSPAFPGFYSTDDNVATDQPFEIVVLPPFAADRQGGANASDYQIVIGKVNDGPARHLRYVNINGLGVSQRQGAPAVFGHAAARGGQAVAATYYAIPNFPEDFSAPGPVTILFDNLGNRLREPDIRQVPQITAADGVDTTFFGFDSDANGKPNFFGTSAAAPNAAAVAALALQAAGGPGSLGPNRLYHLLQRTATPIPLPDDRGWSAALAGALIFTAQGDWTRWKDYFGLTLLGTPGRALKSVSFDVADTGLLWSLNPTRFHVGQANGVARTDITQTVSADQRTMTLAFAAGSFHGGESFRFGMSVFAPQQGTTGEDPDRLRGMKLTATFENGQVAGGTVFAAPKQAFNRFTGAGLLDADAAVRKAQRRSDDD